jgi:hypothetical protein
MTPQSAPGEIRTPDPLIRSQMLYPAELRALEPCGNSGAEGNRTPDLLNAIQALSQLSYGPRARPQASVSARAIRTGTCDHVAGPGESIPAPSSTRIFKETNLRPAGPTGLEPATSGVTVRHSNRLSYGPLEGTGNREQGTGLPFDAVTLNPFRHTTLRPPSERATGLEPATSTLARLRSTN